MQKGKRTRPSVRPARSVASRLLKAFYILLMVLSALIVVTYCLWTYAIHPPTIEEPPAETTPVETGPAETAPGETTPVETGPVRERREQVYTCLIFGMDDGNGNTDTIMVATFDVPNQKIGLMSIPRDTVVRQDRSAAWNKINAAYADGGVEQLDQELEELLGFPIDYYVKIRLSAFEKLVESVGGVWFDVPVDMDYDDPYQDLHIHISKGYQLLNGEQAMQVVRYRQSNSDDSYGDTGRASTQQAFMKAMLSQVLAGADLGSIPTLADVLFNYVETNASLNDIIFFGKSLLGVDLDTALSTATLPADWHSPYMWVRSDEALELINQLLNPYNMEITADMVEFFQR